MKNFLHILIIEKSVKIGSRPKEKGAKNVKIYNKSPCKPFNVYREKERYCAHDRKSSSLKHLHCIFNPIIIVIHSLKL